MTAYVLHLGLLLTIYIVLAQSLNLVLGYLGDFTLAHAGLLLAGAYAYALATLRAGLPFWSAVLIAMGTGAVLGLAVATFAQRLRGDQFMMSTLAIQMTIVTLANSWWSPDVPFGTLSNLTNGPFGIPGIPAPSLPLYGVGPAATAFATAIYGIFSLGLLLILARSPWGRLLRGIRDDELASRALGKRTAAARRQAHAVSGALAAGTGGVYAAYAGYVDPNFATLDDSIMLVAMVVVGGAGNFRGPIIGAALLVLLPEVLRIAGADTATASSLRLIAFGLALVVVMLLRPSGFAGDRAFGG